MFGFVLPLLLEVGFAVPRPVVADPIPLAAPVEGAGLFCAQPWLPGMAKSRKANERRQFVQSCGIDTPMAKVSHKK